MFAGNGERDFRADLTRARADNHIMNTNEKSTDAEALLERVLGSKPLDPEVYRRVRENGERITDELRRKHGEMDIAVELIHEVRSCLRTHFRGADWLGLITVDMP